MNIWGTILLAASTTLSCGETVVRDAPGPTSLSDDLLQEAFSSEGGVAPPSASELGESGPGSVNVRCNFIGLIGEMAECVSLADYGSLGVIDVTEQADWTSENDEILALTEFSLVRGALFQLRKPGTARVTANMDGTSGTFDIEVKDFGFDSLHVTPHQMEVPLGLPLRMKATALYKDREENVYSLDVTKNVGWSSDDTAVATVDTLEASRGLFKGHAPGKVNVEAFFAVEEGRTETASLAVRELALTQLYLAKNLEDFARLDEVEMYAGISDSVFVVALFENGQKYDVTEWVEWNLEIIDAPGGLGPTSEAPFILEGGGVVTAVLANSEAILRASFKNHVAQLRIVSVENQLERLELTPEGAEQFVSQQTSFAVIGHWKNGDRRDVTRSAILQSSNPSVLWVQASGVAKGSALAIRAGESRVSASLEGVEVARVLTVFPSSVKEIALSETNISLAISESVEVKILAILEDGTKIELGRAFEISASSSNVRIELTAQGLRIVAVSGGEAQVSLKHPLFKTPLKVAVAFAPLPSPLPTSSPTVEPTTIPTPFPTSSPTSSPTTMPTSQPTPAPSAKPFTATILRRFDQSEFVNTLPIRFSVEFSEEVVGLTAAKFVQSGTASGVTFQLSGSGKSFVLSATSAAGFGSVLPNLPSGAVSSSSGVVNQLVTTQDGGARYKNSPLNVTFSYAGLQTPRTNKLPVSFELTFSEDVDTATFDASDLINMGTASNVNWVVNASSKRRFVAQATSVSADGTFMPRIAAASIADVYGNPVVHTDSGLQVDLDRTQPTALIQAAPTQTSPTGAFPIVFYVGFSEDVTGFTTSDILQSGTASGVTWNLTGSGKSYTLQATAATSPGTIIPTISTGAVTDLFGNENSAFSGTAHQINYDPNLILDAHVYGTGATGSIWKSQPITTCGGVNNAFCTASTPWIVPAGAVIRTLHLHAASTVKISSDVSIENIIVEDGSTLVLDVPETFASVHVKSGKITTSAFSGVFSAGWSSLPAPGNGILSMTVSGALIVDEGGALLADGLGYRGGNYLDGASFDGIPGTGGGKKAYWSCYTGTPTGGGGGSYGRKGEGLAGAAFGASDFFSAGRYYLGSAGGGTKVCNRDGSDDLYRGGSGGGSIVVDAMSVTNSGVISASGQDAPLGSGGGGSGGTVVLRVSGSLINPGTIRAIGGSGKGGGGAGGVGRIYIASGSAGLNGGSIDPVPHTSFFDTIDLASATKVKMASSAVELTIGSDTFRFGAATQIGAETLSVLSWLTGLSLDTLEVVSGAYRIGEVFSAGNFVVSGGTVEMAAPISSALVTMSAGTLTLTSAFGNAPDFHQVGGTTVAEREMTFRDFTLGDEESVAIYTTKRFSGTWSAGSWTTTPGPGQGQIRVIAQRDFTVGANGVLTVDGFGYPSHVAGHGGSFDGLPGTAGGQLAIVRCYTGGGGGGGSYGTVGGGSSGAVFGASDFATKLYLGSGGGGTNACNPDGTDDQWIGGSGGGAISIRATNFTNAGRISADGIQPPSGSAGGGSGGTIFIEASGGGLNNGTIRAAGGAARGSGGAGGLGRIRILGPILNSGLVSPAAQ